MTDRIRTRRIHDAVSDDDGYRVLVDRVWPRGISKQAAALDEWCRELAPSTELRKWFAHDPERWQGFREAYRDELAHCPEALSRLIEQMEKGRVTLLYSARDREHNQAVVLAEVLAQEWAETMSPNESSSPVCYADQVRDTGANRG
ncbi:DUF488 domain-containing protein [Vreelandella utahensis]|uniref:DUF488 domain-containing protein n=1 Tax=Vreelandella halophila TaxID=86177 RepID=UPI000985A326|nr:DUF488 domain-containing protein [Halomonas utahensis]